MDLRENNLSSFGRHQIKSIPETVCCQMWRSRYRNFEPLFYEGVKASAVTKIGLFIAEKKTVTGTTQTNILSVLSEQYLFH